MSDEFTKRSDLDFLSRSLPALPVYAFFWPLLALSADFFDSHINIAITFTAFFVGISVLRGIHAYYFDLLYNASEHWWRLTIMGLTLCHALTLSAVQVYLILLGDHFNMVILTTLVVVGIIGGAASSLAPKPIFTQIYVAVVLLPNMAACLFNPTFYFLIPLIFIMWVYYIIMCRRYYKEYARAFNIESELTQNQIKLEELNRTDTLTGVYNRQYFDSALDIQWDLARRSQSNLSILFLDLDLFKKVNDEYGHIVGDKALCHAAAIFKETAKRKSDMIARYGGEEFAIFLPCTPHDDAKILAERIRINMEATPLIHGESIIKLSVSIGINASIPNSEISRVMFLDQVDKALYEAKRSGRNRVVSYLDMIPNPAS